MPLPTIDLPSTQTLMSERLHENEFAIDETLVRRLLDEQLPEYRHLQLQALHAAGSSNRLFRLGDHLLVRLPRQPGGAAGIQTEQSWAEQIAPRLPVAIPNVRHILPPSELFPEPWSVVGWLEGDTAENASSSALTSGQRSRLASDLADVVSALRAAPVSAAALAATELKHYRGNTLRSFDSAVQTYIVDCRAIPDLTLDLDAATRVWEDALTLPGADSRGPSRWYHGDLVAENLLLDNGRLVAILDFGGLGVGDPTIDLHGAWELFDASDRDQFRARLEVSESEWLRGRAWALGIALGCFSYYWRKMPGRIADRLVMANAVLEDAGYSVA